MVGWHWLVPTHPWGQVQGHLPSPSLETWAPGTEPPEQVRASEQVPGDKV